MKILVLFFLRRKILTLMLFCSVSIIGILSILKIKMELVPAVPSSSLTISVSWQDASPETIEREIVSKLEGVAATLRGVEDISSLSRRGIGQIIVELAAETEPEAARFYLKDMIRTIELPPGSNVSVLTGGTVTDAWNRDALQRLLSGFSTQNAMPFTLRLSGNESARLLELSKGEIKNSFLSIPGVSEVEVSGGIDTFISLVVNHDILESLEINILDITKALRKFGAAEREIGSVLDKNQVFPVFYLDAKASLEDIGNLCILSPLRGRTTLSELADISIIEAPPENRARVNGRSSLLIRIKKKEEANLIVFSRAIRKKTELLQEKFSGVVTFKVISDAGKKLAIILKDMGIRLGISVVAVFIVLFLFFKRIKPAVLVLSSIFFSLLLTVSALSFLNFSINLITVSAMILSAGMLVDNTLVIYENIFKETDLTTIADKIKRILSVIVTSSATNVVVFLPFMFLSGALGAFFQPFAVTIFLSMFFSLFVSISLTPSVFYHFIAKRKQSAGKARNIQFSIKPALRLKRLLVPAGFLIMLCCFLFPAPNVWQKYSYTTGKQNDAVYMSIDMLADARVEETEEIVSELERLALPAVKDTGLQLIVNVSRTQAFLELEPVLGNTSNSSILSHIQNLWSQKMSNYVSVGFSLTGPNGQEHSYGASSFSGSTGSGIRIEGYDYNILKEHAIAFSRHLRRIPYLYNIDNGFESKKRILFGPSFPGYDIVLDQNRMEKAGIQVSDIENTLESYNHNPAEGMVSIDTGNIRYEILPENGAGFFQMSELLDIPIKRSGYTIGDVALLKPLDSASSITRENQKYIHYISYEVKGTYYREAETQIEALIKAYGFPAGFKAFVDTSYLRLREEAGKKTMALTFLMAAFLVYMVLAGHFEAFTKPLLVFLSVPMALIGVIAGLAVLGYGIGLGGILGLIILAGLAVNDALLFVNTADTELGAEPVSPLSLSSLKIKSGKNKKRMLFPMLFPELSAHDYAAEKAIRRRLRPILITSLTTIIALLPTLFVKAGGDEMLAIWKEFALVVIFGLASSTFFALFYTPLCYSFFNYRLPDLSRSPNKSGMLW